MMVHDTQSLFNRLTLAQDGHNFGGETETVGVVVAFCEC